MLEYFGKAGVDHGTRGRLTTMPDFLLPSHPMAKWYLSLEVTRPELRRRNNYIRPVLEEFSSLVLDGVEGLEAPRLQAAGFEYGN